PYAKKLPRFGCDQPPKPPRDRFEVIVGQGPKPETSRIDWLEKDRPNVFESVIFTMRRSNSSKLNRPSDHSRVGLPSGVRYNSTQRPKLSPSAPPGKNERRFVGF